MNKQIRIRKSVLLLGLLCLACRSYAQGVPKTMLVGDDPSSWRGDTGEWEVVGGAFINPDNERLLRSRSGTGIIINGLNGKTVHLLTKKEFADVNAHIEFMVPKGSNSGVYFMGRYEIQVFDSWGIKKPRHSDCGGI